MKLSFFKIFLGIGSIFVISLSGCSKSPSQNSSVNTSKTLDSKRNENLIQKLPTVEGVTIGEIEYLKAEITPNQKLETAILQQLPGYKFCSTEKSSSEGIRYFYNKTDLNEDGQSEVIVYLVGTYSCGTGGCTTLIFQSFDSGYRLISDLTLINNPIIVSNKKTNGWHDLNLYVSGGGINSNYHIVSFDGQEYPSNPSLQPKLPTNSTVTGKALISEQIVFDTPAPILQSGDCEE